MAKEKLLGQASHSSFSGYRADDGPPQTWQFYQQHVFAAFHQNMRSEIEAAYLAMPRAFRRDILADFVGPTDYVFGQDAWDACYSYLGRVEQAIANIVVRRTAVEWLHLYRRIGVSLDERLGPKTDAITTALVREIAELAMEKHGALRSRSDLVLSTSLRPREILGGLYMREAVQRLGRKAADAEAKSLIRSRQLVLARFSYDDLLDLYRIEGMAYEYWRTTAALRAIGKGVGVRRDDQDFLNYEMSDDLRSLIERYDEEATRTRLAASLVGSWFPNTIHTERPVRIIAAGYNVFDSPFGKQCDAFGVDVTGPIRSFAANFELAPIDVSAFVAANEFLGDAFARKFAFTLVDLAYCLLTLSTLAISPHDPTALARYGLDGAAAEPLFASVLNIAQRGYGVFAGPQKEIVNWTISIAKEHHGVSLDDANIQACLDYMTLSEQSRDFIGLWSRGRRFPVVPIRSGALIDLEAIGGFLLTLFVGVSDKIGARGSAFETMWRRALTEQRFDVVLKGEITAQDESKREVDAGVRIGSTLYLMECRSTERPLDYEIGKPRVLARRQNILQEKLVQAETLYDFLISNPRGRNYDVSWASEIIYFVVGPFEEFIWSKDKRYWWGSTPRILSADKMLNLLENARSG